MPEGRLERTREAYAESTAELLKRLPTYRFSDVWPQWSDASKRHCQHLECGPLWCEYKKQVTTDFEGHPV